MSSQSCDGTVAWTGVLLFFWAVFSMVQFSGWPQGVAKDPRLDFDLDLEALALVFDGPAMAFIFSLDLNGFVSNPAEDE